MDSYADARQSYWSSLGILCEFLSPSEWERADCVIINPDKPPIEFKSFSLSTNASKNIEAYDVLFKDQSKKIWPELFLSEAMRILILDKAKNLDTHAYAYLTGDSGLFKICWVTLIQMGFSKFAIVSKKAEEVIEEVNKIQSRFFNLQVKVLRDSELTLQPNNGSILVNTIFEDENLIQDLSYLNFLRSEGLVVDLPGHSAKNELISEAQQVGNIILQGGLVYGLRDFLVLQNKGLLTPGLTPEKYLSDWVVQIENKTKV